MTTTPDFDVLAELRAQFDGQVITPDDADYDAARTVVRPDIDRRPVAIVRPRDADEVAAVVRAARGSGLTLAVRGGGHSGAGHGVSDGLVLDLSSMTELDIAADRRTAWAGAGLTAGEYTRAVGELGLATGFGDSGSVGIGGITLGGGVGFLSRKYGMSVDSLLAAEVVTATGEQLYVDHEHHPELFWALRGGGGNFGVVTRFRFRLHEVPSVTAGMLVLPATPEVLAGFVAESLAAPEELSAIANVMPAPPMPFVPAEHHGELVVLALLCHAGPVEDGERALAPFRALASPIADLVQPGRYADLFPADAEEFRPQAVVRTGYAAGLDHDTAAAVLDRLRTSNAPMRATQFRVLGGAIGRVDPAATAYAHRAARIMTNVVASFSTADERAERTAWVDSTLDVVRGEEHGAYVNFLADEGPDRVKVAYPGDTWDRLVAVKQEYDPANLFRMNQNVPPGRA